MTARTSILILLAAIGICLHAQAPAMPRPPKPQLMPPIPPSPIQQFRDWLKMSEADRETAMASYSEPKRAVLRQKIDAYAAMPPEQRERRLKMLELRWYMRPLMAVAPEQRGNYREMMPRSLHELVVNRLAQWDQLDAATRTEILANDDAREMTTRYFAYLPRRTAPPMPAVPLADAAQRAELQEKLKYWQQTTPAQRQRMTEQLSAFFELPRPAQQKTLVELSDNDRQEIQRAIDAFGKLSAQHRRAAVESFQKFATMSPAERGEFLRKAERWQQMTPQERAMWRNLVPKLPPMPPEPVERPPMPQARLPRVRNIALN